MYDLPEPTRLITPGLMVLGAANTDHLTNLNINEQFTGSVSQV